MKGRELAVIGIGDVEAGWFPERPGLKMVIDASRNAIMDAGIKKEDIGAVLFGPCLSDERLQLHIAVGRLIDELGLKNCRMNSVINCGGMSLSACITNARGLIDNGIADTVLINTEEQFSRFTPEVAGMFFNDRAGQYYEWEMPYGMTFNSIAAMYTQRYKYDTGTTDEQLASVVEAFRKWGAMNPHARFKKPVTREDVLNSKMVTTPLRSFMCNVVTDGGYAFIVTTLEKAKEMGRDPVYITGHGLGPALHFSPVQNPAKDLSYLGLDKAVEKALSDANVTIDDVDILEAHTSYPVFALMTLEEAGFCKKGEAGKFVMNGNTSPGGKLPMTTHGECLSVGHTGMGSIWAVFNEAITQLRNEAGERQVKDAEIALFTSGGGAYMQFDAMILKKELS